MKPAFPSVYAILTADLVTGDESAIARTLANAGVGLIQYRDKAASSRTLFEKSARIAHALAGSDVRLIVNDRPDIACLVGAGGTHVGQEDLAVEDARAVCGEAASGDTGASSFWVGVSTHTLDQVGEAAETSADYIAVGPIFPTRTKKQSDPVVGTDFIRRARKLTTKPLVAIGGITVARALEVLRAGANCVAVASDLIGAADPAARAREYLGIAASCCK
ncbi:MAG TPA: thiamine phosphate synthase [Candidatus Limnocylindrales bacterium]|nr:thiamine phosphate synthase [Candidatus Limnocylindrales bacterium]